MHPEISVVIPTYNRAAGLPALLARLLDQDHGGVGYEVLVVDNNSTDTTRAVVEEFIAGDRSGRLRYAFEPRQGVSHARNTGIALTSAPVVFFVDDDVVPSRNWVREIKAAFDGHPEADIIGGRVTPMWTTPKPSWFRGDHAGPVAIQDRSEPSRHNAANASACLLGANFGFRRQVFERIGGFSPDYPRNQDRELEMRMWRAGMQGLYLPTMQVHVEIPAERLTRRYHRRWQATTGHYHARLRFRDTVDANGVMRDESRDVRRLFGTPLFLYRAFLKHAAGWLGAIFDPADRFYHETRLWYYVSFFRTRWRSARVEGTATLTPSQGT